MLRMRSLFSFYYFSLQIKAGRYNTSFAEIMTLTLT